MSTPTRYGAKDHAAISIAKRRSSQAVRTHAPEIADLLDELINDLDHGRESNLFFEWTQKNGDNVAITLYTELATVCVVRNGCLLWRRVLAGDRARAVEVFSACINATLGTDAG